MNKEQKKAIILCYPIPYILKVKAQLKAKGKLPNYGEIKHVMTNVSKSE